jgi:hypothetical protein
LIFQFQSVLCNDYGFFSAVGIAPQAIHDLRLGRRAYLSSDVGSFLHDFECYGMDPHFHRLYVFLDDCW